MDTTAPVDQLKMDTTASGDQLKMDTTAPTVADDQQQDDAHAYMDKIFGKVNTKLKNFSQKYKNFYLLGR